MLYMENGHKFWAQVFYKQVFHSWESSMGYSHKKHGAILHCAKDCLILCKKILSTMALPPNTETETPNLTKWPPV